MDISRDRPPPQAPLQTQTQTQPTPEDLTTTVQAVGPHNSDLSPIPIAASSPRPHAQAHALTSSPRSSSSLAADNERPRDSKFSFRNSNQPLPPLPEDIDISPHQEYRDSHPDPRSIPLNTRRISLASGLTESAEFRRKTAGERLDPTLLTAIAEKEKYAFKARLTGFALNAAIGMQVVLGALTTGLSVVTTGHQTQVMTAVLGGIATIVASYLARARGSNEPELSIARVKDLEQFIRECEAFKMDRGHVVDDTEDAKVLEFRRRFEDLLGNASGERKLSA